MTTQEIISQYLDQIQQGLINDASAKGQKIPVESFSQEVTADYGALSGAHYFQYLVTGRGPGKFPPPDAMLKAVQANPEMLADARKIWKNITEESLAFLIGRKISRYGTDIFTGRKKGIDLTGVVDAALPDFLEKLAYHQAVNVGDKIEEAALV